jgi:8-oxo-dGTP diphosphatase
VNGSTVVAFDKTKKKILLVKRRDVPVWVLPGGGIEKGETPAQAAIRETFEESGFKVKIIRKVAEYSHANGRLNHLFEAKITEGKATLSPESKAVEFFPINDLPSLKHPSIDSWLKDVFANQKEVIKKSIKSITARQALKQFHKHPFIVIRFLLLKWFGIRINI